jgi:hypothetical protein
MTAKDLRHSCFQSPEFRPQEPTGDWVQLGAYGAVVVWEEDGLERVAQWSSSGGLHIYTEGLHRSCIRVVCGWTKAKAIVSNLRRTTMDELMKRNEEIVSKLVEAAKHGWAVVMVGDYGSGKVWLSDMALKRMGREACTIHASQLDADDVYLAFQKLPENSGAILDLDHLHDMEAQILPMIVVSAVEFVRIKQGVLFITVRPGQENALSLFNIVTGESMGLPRQTVEVPR